MANYIENDRTGEQIQLETVGESFEMVLETGVGGGERKNADDAGSLDAEEG